MAKKVDIIATLGPSTNSEEAVRKLKSQGIAFVRINMSHSTLKDLVYFIKIAKKVGIPFIIDTEGSQIRTGRLKVPLVRIEENDKIRIYKKPVVGNSSKICLTPKSIIGQLEPGDILRLDFDMLVLRISDTSTLRRGYITARAVAGGTLGENKGVVIDQAFDKGYVLPALSPKDYQSIKIGLREGVKYIAASFMRSGEFVDEVRHATHGKMKIISKVECADGLRHLDEIIKKSDAVLIDRGDLSKEITPERIPFTQKIIIDRARKLGKGAIVATNLLETMVQKQRPTRAEIHDVVSTILDGATGLTLSSETAIGKYPFECANTVMKLAKHTLETLEFDKPYKQNSGLIQKLNKEKYLLNFNSQSALIAPHGGKLVNRCIFKRPKEAFLSRLPKVKLAENQLMDLEQIAIGTFSPLEGFMNKKEVNSVLNKMRLPSGVVWPIPIVLDVSEEIANSLTKGKPVALLNESKKMVGLLHLDEMYKFDKAVMARKLYGTQDINHPGVKMITKLNPVFLAGKVDLFERRKTPTQEFELTPFQVRRLFEEKNWSRVIGFHTRNVIHRSHEFIQMKAMEQEFGDGLFVQPVVGQKKRGDFQAKYIIDSYRIMIQKIYPKNKIIFAVLATYSRYAGPREAIFTALCRKNFGCSHFIVGRDHTGVGNFYSPTASHEIFNKFPDLGIKPIKFKNVFYSTKRRSYVLDKDKSSISTKEKNRTISGTEAREIFRKHKIPPAWFMRPEISKMIARAVKKNEPVFVNEPGRVLWFTGLSGSGKTTLAKHLAQRLEASGKKVIVLDGDLIRATYHKHLGFSRRDIHKNNLLVAKMAKKESANADFVLVPIISPFRADRTKARDIVGNNFVEVFINTPLEECIKRDIKGLYKKALKGEIKNFIGVSKNNPYQVPQTPDIEIDTMRLSIKEGVQKVFDFLG